MFYNTFKKEFKPEGYLDQIKHISARKKFAKLRISSHQLQIETGRYRTDKIFRANRICQFCNLNETEDENIYCFIAIVITASDCHFHKT